MLGFTLARAGRFDEGFALLSRYNGEARAHYDLARMLRHMNQPQPARRHAALAVEKDPSLAEARSLLAELDGKAPPPSKPVKTAGYTAPAPVTRAPEGVPAEGSETTPRPIRLPPLPVVPIHSRGDSGASATGG
jgi:hypothetical protein